MYRPGEKVWLKTTIGETLATVIDPETKLGVVIYSVEIEGGPRILALENELRRAYGADVPLVVEVSHGMRPDEHASGRGRRCGEVDGQR